MGNLLAQAQRMQRAIDDARAELRALVIEGIASDGHIAQAAKAYVSGDGNLMRIEIHDAAFRGAGRAQVEELVASAVRDAQEKAHRRTTERLAEVTGGLNLPGFL